VLQDIEYPDPLWEILLVSIELVHPAQFEFTLVVQYQVSGHGSVSVPVWVVETS
jgi:hypothetical protein